MLQRVVTCRDLAAMHVITEVTDERVGGEAALVEPHRETKGELSPGEVQKRHVPCREPHRRGLPPDARAERQCMPTAGFRCRSGLWAVGAVPSSARRSVFYVSWAMAITSLGLVPGPVSAAVIDSPAGCTMWRLGLAL
jgi:hypothetical protein